MYIKNAAEFIEKYNFYVREKEYWLEQRPISIHEEQNKRYFINLSTNKIKELIETYPEYAKAYYLI
jgi:hypothetical protein